MRSLSKWTVVEPHADDAFLSCHQHMVNALESGIDVRIVTIFGATRKRAYDAKAYADAIGARWTGCAFTEGLPLPDPESFFALLAASGLRFEDDEQIILPVCVKHPEHFAVRDLFERSKQGSAPYLYYLDQPYAGIPKNSPLTLEAIAGMRAVSYIMPLSKKYKHIPLFKDQAKFFYFNPSEKLKSNPEILLEK